MYSDLFLDNSIIVFSIFSKSILSERMLNYLKKNRGFNLKILFVAENEIYTI